MWSTGELAEMAGVSQRTVRSWIERGWLDGRDVNGRFWVVSTQQLTDFLLGRADAYREWVEGRSPYRPRQWWSLRWRSRVVTVGLHYQVDTQVAGPDPFTVRTWYVVEVSADGPEAPREVVGETRLHEDGRLYRPVTRIPGGRARPVLRTQNVAKARKVLADELHVWERARYRTRLGQAQGWHGPRKEERR